MLNKQTESFGEEKGKESGLGGGLEAYNVFDDYQNG